MAHASSARWLVRSDVSARWSNSLVRPDRDRRRGSQALDELLGDGVELVGRHGAMDQTPGGGIRSGDLLAQHEHLPGAGHADQTGDEPGGRTVRREREGGEGRPEPGIVRHHGEVRGQEDVETEADDPAACGADDRCLAGEHRRDEAVDVPVHAPMHRAHPWALGTGRPLGEIEARGEVLALHLRDG